MFFADLSEWTGVNVILRMIAAFVLGALIGIDRGAKRRGGGARTDAAVCLGAAMVVMTGQYMEMRYQGTTDVARMASQVVSGVGFLGAGSIIVSRHQVKGLTSAAGIWVCACIGLAVGIGFVDGAVLATLILLGGLHVLPMIETKVYKHSRYMVLQIEAAEGGTSIELMRKLRSDGCIVDLFEVDRAGTDTKCFLITLTVCIPRRLNREQYLESLMEIGGILSVDHI